MPLLQLFNTLTDPSTPEEVDKSLVLDHVTSALIILGSASQVVALTRQRAFDELLDKRFDSIKKNAPSADFLFGGSILKDIEDAEKASKLASKVTRGQPSSSKSNRWTPYAAALSRRRGRSQRSFRDRFSVRPSVTRQPTWGKRQPKLSERSSTEGTPKK